MARYPDAYWNPKGTPGGTITPRVVIVHTMGVNAYCLPREPGGLEWHFGVAWSGKVQQHVDTTRRADANYKANPFAISIETEDDGDPDRQPWSEEQLVSLARLIRWCCNTHGIPKVRCKTWDGTGIGFHTMFGAPSKWTPVAKSCPGAARKAQFPRLLEMVAGATPDLPEDFTMAGLNRDDALRGVVRQAFRANLLRNPETVTERDNHVLHLAAVGYDRYLHDVIQSAEGQAVLAKERAAVLGV